MLSITQTQLKGRGQGSSMIAFNQVNHKGTEQNGEGWIWNCKLRKPAYTPRITQVMCGQVAASPLIQVHIRISVKYHGHGASFVVQLGKNLPAMQETQVQSLGWEDALKKEMASQSSILTQKIPWIEKPVGCSPCGHKESGTTGQLTLSITSHRHMGFPAGSVHKESACNAGVTGDSGLIPGLGRSSGGGHGNLLQYSCLENSMDKGVWWATVHRVTKSQT